MLYLAVYAIIAIVIISKLYNTLGKGGSSIPIVNNYVVHQQEIIHASEEDAAKYPKFQSTIDEILKRDKSFMLSKVLAGAEKAFEIIVKSVDNNDQSILRSLLSEDVYKYFQREIERRSDHNEEHQTTIVAMKSQELEKVDFSKNNITITIKFVSEQNKLVRNKDTKELIKGDISSMILVEDTWSFMRNVKSSSSKWMLVAV